LNFKIANYLFYSSVEKSLELFRHDKETSYAPLRVVDDHKV
jgi:hypothetical protein